MWWAALAWLLVTWALAEWVGWGETIPDSSPRFKVFSTLVVAAAWPVSLPIAAVKTIKDLRRK